MKPLYLISLALGLAVQAQGNPLLYASRPPSAPAGKETPLIPLQPATPLTPLQSAPVKTDNCHLSVSNNRVDYGRIIQSLQPMALASQTVQVTVSCLQPAYLMLTVQAQSAGEHYSLGAQGQLSISLHDAVLDGRPVDLSQTGVNGGKPIEGQGVTVSPLMAGVIPILNHQPMAGKQWSLQLTTAGRLDTRSHPVSQAAPFQNTVVLILSQQPDPKN